MPATPGTPTVAATPGGGGSTGGELPVTGAAGIAYAVGGVALVAAGLTLLAGVRRRRIRFVTRSRRSRHAAATRPAREPVGMRRGHRLVPQRPRRPPQAPQSMVRTTDRPPIWSM
ncbi:LPXTG cell wall anchor domain-containing protein [Micromonospora sp. LOL_021]|uniref:LPXTG cell wall anchor domain-containing protein n=1 Tax=Micromonospora sp. LOL_021 TaxID=3345417 RepID=UPI003A86D6D7